MAVGAVPNPSAACQGSVQAADAPERTPEKATVFRMPEVKQAERSGQNTFVSGQEGDGGSNSGNPVAYMGTEAMKKAVEEINRNAKNSEAIFGVHDRTNRITIKIVDKDTKEVIKEYPPEKTLDMIAKVLEMAGLMVDEKR